MSLKIAIISGSTRKERNTHRVALALEKAFAREGVSTFMVDLLELPIGKFEERLVRMEEKDPDMVLLSEKLAGATAMVFVSPEYNGSISASLKWFIDFFGRSEFGGKPIGVATVSNGVLGGVRAAYQLQQIILAIQAYPQPQMLLTPEVTRQFDENGDLINPEFAPKMDTFVHSFSRFASRF